MNRLRAAAVLACLLLAAGPALGSWQLTQQLTSAADNCNLPAIGRGLAVRDSFVHIAYAGRMADHWRVFYLRSTDRGVSWAAPVLLDDALEAFMFSIAAGGEGHVHLITRRPVGRLSYRRSTDNGASWQPAQTLGGTENPLLLTDGGSHIYVIDPAGSDVDAGLYIRRSTDNGTSWLAPAFIAADGGFGGLCAAATRSGRVHVAWGYGPSGESHIYHVRSTNRGASWGSVQRVTTTTRVTPAGVWAGADPDLLLAFTRYQGPQNYRYSNDGGGSWSAEMALPVLLGDCATDTFSGVHALGVKDDARVMYLRSASHGARWTDTLNISGSEPGTRSRVQLGVDEGDNLYAVWNSRQTGQVQVYLRRGVGLAGVEHPADREPARSLRLNPNPGRGAVWLSGAGRARLYDRLGVERARLVAGSNDISRLPDGVYFAAADSCPARPVKLVKAGR